MKKIAALLTVFMLLSLALSACVVLDTPPPTSTPTAQPSDTPLPTSTAIPTPTDTPVPTEAPTLEPTLTPADTQTAGACVSTDKTYGYTQENPIKVGGDFLDGPVRERAYLDNLAGPNGETITYARIGSIIFGETILDAFVITGLGAEVTLYIDEYVYAELQAPVGFTCLGAFLGAP